MHGERWVASDVVARVAWAAFVPRIEFEGRRRRAWRTKLADRVPMLGLADVRALLAERETSAACRGIGAVAFAWLFELVDAVGELRWRDDEAVASLASTAHGELWAMQQRGITRG